MTNRQFEQSNEPFWYPQLPDGYQEQERNRHHYAAPVPLPHNQHGPTWTPGYQPVPHGAHGGMTGFPPPFGDFFPPFSNWHGGGTGFPPTQQPSGHHPPQSPPPNWTPEYPTVQTRAIDPGAISGCLFRFTYVWQSRRQGFWFFPVFVGPRSVAGYRWNTRRNRWEYTGLDLNQINSFTCI